MMHKDKSIKNMSEKKFENMFWWLANKLPDF